MVTDPYVEVFADGDPVADDEGVTVTCYLCCCGEGLCFCFGAGTALGLVAYAVGANRVDLDFPVDCLPVWHLDLADWFA